MYDLLLQLVVQQCMTKESSCEKISDVKNKFF